MTMEYAVDQLYQQTAELWEFLQKIHNKKMWLIFKDLLAEILRTGISWLVLSGVVLRTFVEVVLLQGLLWWLSPFDGSVAE